MTSSRVNPWFIVVAVSLATFMEVLDTTVTNVSLRHIAGSLGAGQDEGTWVLTSYLVSNGIILPLSGWLADVVGRKRFFISCILGFTLASFFCGTATSLTGLILFRILQGIAGGGLQPIQQAIILDRFPPEKRGAVFAVTGITMVAAPILGPMLGGLITDNLSWRWIFYINVPVGLISAFLVWRLVEDPPHAKAKGFKKVDYWGLGLISLGLAALQIVLDKGQQEDWFNSPFIANWALICFVCLVVAVIWLWEQKDAIIDLSLFKDRSFALSCILIFVVGFVLFGGTALLPLLLQSHFGYDATLAGMILSPGGMTIIFLMPLIGTLIHKVEARYMIFFGLILCILGCFHTMHFSPATDFYTFMFMRISQVLGLPFLFIPISTLAFSNVPKEKSNKASALFSMFRNIGGSVGIAVALSIVLTRQQVHQFYLSEHLIPGSPPYDGYLAKILALTGDMPLALQYTNNTLQTTATILGYIDAFGYLAFLLAITLFAAILWLPANRLVPQAAASTNVH